MITCLLSISQSGIAIDSAFIQEEVVIDFHRSYRYRLKKKSSLFRWMYHSIYLNLCGFHYSLIVGLESISLHVKFDQLENRLFSIQLLFFFYEKKIIIASI